MKVNQKETLTPDAEQSLKRLGAYLRATRLLQRKTHQDAALSCGFSRQTLARIERGDPSVAIGQVVRYAHHLGASQALSAPEFEAPTAVRVRKRWSEVGATA